MCLAFFLKIQRIWLDYYHINISFFKFWNNPHKIFFLSCQLLPLHCAEKLIFKICINIYNKIEQQTFEKRSTKRPLPADCSFNATDCEVCIDYLLKKDTDGLWLCNIMYINTLGISNSSNDVFMIRIIKYLKKIVFV